VNKKKFFRSRELWRKKTESKKLWKESPTWCTYAYKTERDL